MDMDNFRAVAVVRVFDCLSLSIVCEEILAMINMAKCGRVEYSPF